MRKIIIESQAELEDAIEYFGILPFFSNSVKGFSIEEMTSPGLLFGGNEYEGCWEWKGPIVRERNCAYGKFFKRKAGYVSRTLLPHFLNLRRERNKITPDSTEEMLYDIISINDSITSTELRSYLSETGDDFPFPGRRTGAGSRPKRHALEGPLQRLQMAGRICISDFRYKITKKGERYGWGVAEYSTPEFLFPQNELQTDVSAEESLEILTAHVISCLGAKERGNILKLLL